ncbi:MAG: RNA polymerase sigma factor [Acidobacteriota bacterium]
MAQKDTELIMKAQKGDIAAFEELIFQYDKTVLNIAAQFVHSADDAKDIYQEVLIRVYKGLPRFRFESEFSTWMYRIATNVCLTHAWGRQRHRRHLRHDDAESPGDIADESHDPYADAASADPLPDEAVMNDELLGQVRHALDRLSPRQRMIFTLKHDQGMKLRDIAAILQCTEGTVKKHLFTAMQRLRTQLQHVLE